MESLERSSIKSEGMYLLYNALSIYIYVGKDLDTFFLQQLFKVDSIHYVDKSISEEEMFADADQSPYLTALYSIINQVRYQRQPFCELRILVEGIDQDAENVLS